MKLEKFFNGKDAELTTEHAASSYGIPILSMDGEPYGTADMLISGDSEVKTVLEIFTEYVKTHGLIEHPLVERFLNGATLIA